MHPVFHTSGHAAAMYVQIFCAHTLFVDPCNQHEVGACEISCETILHIVHHSSLFLRSGLEKLRTHRQDHSKGKQSQSL